MRRLRFLAVLALLMLSVAMPVQSALADGGLPTGAIPAAPPVVHRVISRVKDDGSREVIGLEKMSVATSAYIVPAAPPDASKSVARLKGSNVAPSANGSRISPLALGEGDYNHIATYNIASASVKQTTSFHQDANGSQTIYWTKYESQNGVGFGIVWFRFRNMADSQVCCSWQANSWAPYTRTTNQFVDSRGSGTRLENFLDDNTNWWADYYVEFVVGI